MKYEDLAKKWFKINPFLMIFDDDFSKICDEEKAFVQPWLYRRIERHEMGGKSLDELIVLANRR